MLFKNKKYDKLIKQAKLYYKKEDFINAIKTYEEAFKIKALLPDYLMYGYLLIDLEEYNKAEQLLDELSNKLDISEIHFALANIYERTNRKYDAITMYEKVLEQASEFEPAHFSLAYIYDDLSEEAKEEMEGENTKKAICHYEKAIELNDNNFWSHINLGSIYERYNDNEKALTHFLKAYEIDKTKEMVCYNLGVVYYKLKNYDESLKYYNEELTKENPFKSTYYNLGILYKDGFKDYEKAKMYYLKGLDGNEEEYNIWYNLGCIHALLEDFKNAFECFKYIYYKKKKYLGYLDDDPELEEFRKTEYYHFLKEGL